MSDKEVIKVSVEFPGAWEKGSADAGGRPWVPASVLVTGPTGLVTFWAQSPSETYLSCPESPGDATLTSAGSQAHMFRLALIAADKSTRYK